MGRTLLDRDVVHKHTLDAGDVKEEGQLDIFAAEIARWISTPRPADHPDATAWIRCGGGIGSFNVMALKTGDGWPEGKFGDFGHDGDIGVLNKLYIWDAPRVDLRLDDMSGRKAQRSGAPNRRPG